jgi:nickel/cobalt transporter (NicO) family protein
VLFIIFVFGPCEVFIPTYLYPAAQGSTLAVAAVSLGFLLTTVGTMNLVVYSASKGLRYLRLGILESHPHLFAGGILFLSGLAVVLGL